MSDFGLYTCCVCQCQYGTPDDAVFCEQIHEVALNYPRGWQT